jgi:hypothetical protein
MRLMTHARADPSSELKLEFEPFEKFAHAMEV